MNFTNWIDTFVSEKGIDLEERFEVEGPMGTNSIPYGCVVEAIKQTQGAERDAIKTTIVKIDFCNGDVKHFFRHLGQALAQ
jgi:hypothetical protein